jgi:hypothetical protein
VRSFAVFGALIGVLLVAACSTDDSSSGDNSQSTVPPSNCAEPCMVGSTCYGPADSTCNGTWYCWSDTKWHCQPPDGGGPGGYPPDATTGEDAAIESSTPTEAASPADASGG